MILVVDALQFGSMQYLVNVLVVILKKPFVYGALNGF